MLIVTTQDVGQGVYDRLVRDRLIRVLTPGVALPADVEDGDGLRALVATHGTPSGLQVTGLTALWVAGVCPPPSVTHARAERSRGPVRRSPARRVHAVGCAGDGPVAAAPVAVVDALRWEAHDLAVPAALTALDAGQVARVDVEAALGSLRDRDGGPAERGWALVIRALCARRDGPHPGGVRPGAAWRP